MSAAAKAWSLVVPPLCVACGGRGSDSGPVCGDCARSLRRLRPVGPEAGFAGSRWGWSLGRYEGVLRALVVALKARRHLAVAVLLAREIHERLPARLPERATAVPVPASPWRRRLRGFDPAAELAGRLAAEAGVGCRSCLRREDLGRQVGRDRAARVADPPGIRLATAPPEGPVVLVDDVATTGATLRAAVQALRAGGTADVIAVTAARSLGGPRRRT